MLSSAITKNNTVNLSCRLDKAVYELLLDEATKKGISLNSLVNSITKKHTSWEKNGEQIGFVPISKRTVRQIFNDLETNQIKSLAIDIESSMLRDLIMLIFNSNNFATFMSVIEMWGSKFGALRHDVKGSMHIITIYHEINEKFSDYIEELHKAMAKDFGFKLVTAKKTKTTITMEIEENNNHRSY